MASKKDGRKRAAERAAAVHEARSSAAADADGGSKTGSPAAGGDLPDMNAVRMACPRYQGTRTYLQMGADARRALAAYAREYRVADDALFYQLYLHDLTSLGEDEKKRANQPGEFMLVGAIVFAIAMVALQQPVPIFIATGTLVLMTVLFFSGVLNPFKAEQRRAKRWLKKNLDVPVFEQ